MPSPRPGHPTPGHRVLQIISALELLSLLIIVINRFTVHSPVITSTGGPIHGLLYVSTILLALLLPLPRTSKWLSVVPGIGGILALGSARRHATQDAHERTPPARPTGQTSATARADTVVLADELTKALSDTVTIGPLGFTVPRGQITGLIGPNGAGKTTTLRTLVGLIRPTTGRIAVLGHDVEDLAAALGSVGALIEGPTLIDSLSARDNLLVLTRLAGWSDAMADHALDRVGLAAVGRVRVSTFSLGMKQRLGLAAALLDEPELVILDEPSNGLDPQGSAWLRVFLRELAQGGSTVIVSSHILSDIEQVCDHLIVMSAGTIVFEGAPATMISATLPELVVCRVAGNSGRAALQRALADHEFATRLADDPTELVVLTGAVDSARINTIAIQAGLVLAELRPVRPTLQDAFFALTGAPDALDGISPVRDGVAA